MIDNTKTPFRGQRRRAQFTNAFSNFNTHVNTDVKASSVVADGLNGACHHRLFTEGKFFGGFWLFINVRIPVLIVAGKIRGRGIAANVAVDTHSIDVKPAANVVRQFVRDLRHFTLSFSRFGH